MVTTAQNAILKIAEIERLPTKAPPWGTRDGHLGQNVEIEKGLNEFLLPDIYEC